MRIFVYEYVSAGGLGPDAPASLLREGRAMLDAVAADFARVPGVEVLTLARDDELRFRQLAGLADASLIIAPEFDDVLLRKCQQVLAAGGHLLGPTPDAIRLTADKLALAEHWQAQGVPTPATGFTCETFPQVWKLRDGAGSQDMRLVHSPANLAGFRPSRKHIVQPYVPGSAVSVSVLVGSQATLTLAPCAQHLVADWGFHYKGGSLPIPAALAARATQLALRAIAPVRGLQGYVGVDMILGEAGDFAIEINPRLTTSYVGLRKRYQVSLAEVWLKLWKGEAPAPLAEKDVPICFTAEP